MGTFLGDDNVISHCISMGFLLCGRFKQSPSGPLSDSPVTPIPMDEQEMPPGKQTKKYQMVDIDSDGFELLLPVLGLNNITQNNQT